MAEKFLGYIFPLFLRPEATTVGQTVWEGSSEARCPFSKSQPRPLLPSPAVSGFLTFFPSLLPEQMQFGKRQATVTASARGCLLPVDGFRDGFRPSRCSACLRPSWVLGDGRWSGQESRSGPCASVIKGTHKKHLLGASHYPETSACVTLLISTRTLFWP